VARQALTGLAATLRGVDLRPALVNGAAGVVVTVRGRPITVISFTVADGRIAEIDAIADPDRIRRITAAAVPDQ
jgi:RNA polymerase sigma-70 factor (ECF subfamily)